MVLSVLLCGSVCGLCLGYHARIDSAVWDRSKSVVANATATTFCPSLFAVRALPGSLGPGPPFFGKQGPPPLPLSAGWFSLEGGLFLALFCFCGFGDAQATNGCRLFVMLQEGFCHARSNALATGVTIFILMPLPYMLS